MLLENFPVGTLARYGLDYPRDPRRQRGIVYVSCTGFGQSGPYAHAEGYDTMFQAMGGIMSLTGERGGAPVKPGLPVADLTSGLWVAIAILAGARGAHAHRQQGCHVDFSMLDGQIALLTLAAARYFALGEVPPRLGTEHPGRVPSASFRCADGGYLHITASDQHWPPLCRALGLEAWGSEPGLRATRARAAARRGHGAARRRNRRARSRRGRPPRSMRPACRGPDERRRRDPERPARAARGLVGSFDHPGVGEFTALALPFKFLGWDDPDGRRPPLLGEHTESVLAERLGLSRERIAAAQRGKGDMTLTTVLYDVDDGVATITLNRPESRNALNRAMCEDCVAAAAAAAADADVRLVFVRGNGPGVLRRRRPQGAQGHERRPGARRGGCEASPPITRSSRCRCRPSPWCTARRSARAVEIAAACDFIVGDAGGDVRARPRRCWGTVGATQRLPRVLGKRLAKDLMFTGRRLTAEERARSPGW